MPNAFVTGGSGFVGRNLIPALCAAGYQVRALARSAAAARAVEVLGAEPARGDLGDGQALKAGMAGCQDVFHAGAALQQGVRREESYRVNVGGTERVLASAREAGV